MPWTIRQRDRIYNLLLAGGQGSGKSSLLLRLAMSDILAANTATIVLDMKGTLSERLLRLAPPDIGKRWWDDEQGSWQEGEKRLWYLDLGRPAFGLTPLRVEPGWIHAGLADEFARLADAICRALLDLYPGQIMGSSEDLIERAVVGTMAIAWWEHEQRCQRDGLEPTARGFSGSFEVLAQMFAPSDRFDAEEVENRGRRRLRPNRWHQAAGRACQKLPNLDQVADTLLYEIPRQARDNLADIAKRMEAPANKIRPLVGAAASVRRFVGHPERLSLRSVIEAHDILLVNPRIELIGEDQASILTDFVVHMLDLELKRLVALPRSRRPRVSLIIDEAHRLVTDTLITMTATHREAGLTVAAAVQYVSQLGADAPSAAHREKILKGVGNLLQTKVLFRMSDSDDANRHSQIFRSVYETTVRADPVSRARMPFDPARMQSLADHHALVSLVCCPDGGHSRGLVHGDNGATRLPAFVSQTYRMPEVEEIPDDWRAEHLARQDEVFTSYPEDMTALAVTEIPAGLAGDGAAAPQRSPSATADARAVAEQTVGRAPDGALCEQPPASSADVEPATGAAPAAAREEDVTASGGDAHDPRLFATAPRPPGGDATPAYDERLFDPGSSASAAERKHRAPGSDRPAGWERVGGVRVERAERSAPSDEPSLAASRALEIACRPTRRPLPSERDLAPATASAREAVREAAAFELVNRLGDWLVAGDHARSEARRAASAAHERARAEAEAGGHSAEQARRVAERRARRAAAEVLARHTDGPWRTPIGELELGDQDVHTLEVIARLRFAAPRLLAALLAETPSQRVLRERLARLHDAALITRTDVSIEGRRGRRPRLFAAAPRGLEYLRHRHAELRPDRDTPSYLQPSRQPPTPGKGRDVAHELAVQLVAVALSQYGGTATELHWHTTRMPGGRWDIGMIHHDRRDRTLRLTDLLPAAGISAHGERLDAPVALEPDLSIQLQGRAQGDRAAIDLLVEVDRTDRGAYNSDKFTAYDHFLGGWCLHTRRWGAERASRPIVLFVARTARATLTLLHAADPAMGLGFAPRGQYDSAAFAYPGRAHTAFTCLDWLLAGQALALRLPRLPPGVRGHHTELRPEPVALLPEEWWPRPAPLE